MYQSKTFWKCSTQTPCSKTTDLPLFGRFVRCTTCTVFIDNFCFWFWCGIPRPSICTCVWNNSIFRDPCPTAVFACCSSIFSVAINRSGLNCEGRQKRKIIKKTEKQHATPPAQMSSVCIPKRQRLRAVPWIHFFWGWYLSSWPFLPNAGPFLRNIHVGIK